jgi:RHS repeat-associated protein
MATNLLGVAMLLLVLSAAASAQSGNTAFDGFTPEGLKAGAPAGSYQLTGFDNVNYFNGNLNFNLPLLHVGGRGEAGFTIPLRIERKWRVIKTPSPPWVNTPEPNDWQAIDPGYGPGVLIGRRTGLVSQSCNSIESSTTDTLTRFTFTAGDGTEYELRDTALNGITKQTIYSYCSVGLTFNRGKVFVSADGTGVTFISDTDILDSDASPVSQIYPNGYLLMPNGSRYRIDSGKVTWIRDRNGNKISFQYGGWGPGGLSKITDSLNREVNIAYGNDPATPYNDHDEITFKGFGGGSTVRTIKIFYSQMSSVMATDRNANPPVPYPIKSYGQLFPEMNGSTSTPFDQQQIVSSVELPDGRSYQFRYNSYGELARVELPTGGAIEYDYLAGLSGGLPTASGSYGGGGAYIDKQIYRRVSARRVYGDKNSSIYEYKTTISRPESIGGGNLGYVDVENLDYYGAFLSKERHYYTGSARVPIAQQPTDYSQWKTGREWKTESFASDGTTTLRRMENTWQQPQDGYSWPLTMPEANDTVRANNPKITQTLNTLVDTNQVSKQTFAFDAHFNQTDVYEFDYGSGAAPTYATRHTHSDYVTVNAVNGINYAGPASGPNYTPSDYHIRNLPWKKIVYSVNTATGAESKASQAEFEYDRYDASAYHASLLGRSDISGMDSGYIATNSSPARGNVTKVTSYSDAVGLAGAVSSYKQYDVAGNVLVSVDALGNATTFDFRDNFGSPDGTAQSGGNPSNTAPPELSAASKKAYAIPFKMSNALGHTSYAQYDYYLGKPVDSEDPNGVKSSIYYADALDRPTKGIRAVGTAAAGQTLFIYNDKDIVVSGNPPRSITTIKDKDVLGESNSGNGLKSLALYDGLGRTWRGATYEGNTGAGNTWAIADTQFDGLGRVSKTSNPYRAADPSAGAASPPSGTWTATTYDALGRALTVQTPDTAVVTTVYSGNAVTVIDPAGKQRRSLTDGLGRLIRVDEPDGTNSLGAVGSPTQPTYYTYDALGNLRRVQQGTQTRWFAYDSLSRLIYAKNPEQTTNSAFVYTDNTVSPANTQWSVKYQYDANGNLLQKTDARNVGVIYAYDALNRNTTVNYDNTAVNPDITRYYDNSAAGTYGKGRFWYDYAGGDYSNGQNVEHKAIDGYDPLGRPLSMRRHFKLNGTWSNGFTTSQTCDLAGNVKAITYPSGNVVNYSYNAAGQQAGFTGKLGGLTGGGPGGDVNYATGMQYNPRGQMIRETFGTNAALYHRKHYNRRGQLFDIRLGTDGSSSWDVEDPQVWQWANGSWNLGALRLYYSASQNDYSGANPAQADNNGNVYYMEHFVPTALDGSKNITNWVLGTDSYLYDELNRIKRVTESYTNYVATSIKQSYLYDRYGNRRIDLANTDVTSAGSGVTRIDFKALTANNRLVAASDTTGDDTSSDLMRYDKAGNLVVDNYSPDPGKRGGMEYDAENRMTKAVGISHQYRYDADGKRTRKLVSGSLELWLVYGVNGELVAEYDATLPGGTLKKEYGYRGGQMLVVYDSALATNDKLKWMVTDHLGSTRMVVNRTGDLGGVQRRDYLPFGEELASTVGHRAAPGSGYAVTVDPRQKFGSKERDNETGLDFFEARYFCSTQGRFTSPDEFAGGPVELFAVAAAVNPTFFADLTNPQSLNKYQYCYDNPLRYVDSNGHLAEETNTDPDPCCDPNRVAAGAATGAGVGAVAGAIIGGAVGGAGGAAGGTLVAPGVGTVGGAVGGGIGGAESGAAIGAAIGGAIGGGLVIVWDYITGSNSQPTSPAVPPQTAAPPQGQVQPQSPLAPPPSQAQPMPPPPAAHAKGSREEQRLIKHIAKDVGVSVHDLGAAVHAEKETYGRDHKGRRPPNLTKQQIRELAEQIKDGSN